ncbi:hypothetical protein LTR53_009476 [Teratosphaeriaceae sp. CCFEE 6253]|nr:hypothetical protein LTR53_009476 [Teratosphaeriaceae sp. CCFEE 6253]
MWTSLTSSFAAAALVVVAFALSRIVHKRFISPLRHIPGPFLASITDKWLLWYDLAGLRTLTIDALHRQYGAVLRVAPNEVSFADASVVNQIYGPQTAFMKAPVYESMSIPPLGIFSLRDKAAHSQRRGLLSHAFAQQNIADCTPTLARKVDLLLALFRREGVGEATDVLLRFRLFALDCVGELFLGKSFGALESGLAPRFLHDMDQHFLLGGVGWNFPWVMTLLRLLPIPAIRLWLGSSERIAQYGNTAFRDYVQRYGRDSKRRDLLTKILVPEGQEAVLTDRETYVEVGNLVFAGTDTTSTTLTYMFWCLARYPAWQGRIREEMGALLGGRARGPYDQKSMMVHMPVVDAVINESLRMYPARPPVCLVLHH